MSGTGSAGRSYPERRVVVQYRVKPELVDENQRLVRAVFEELDRMRPEGLRYATFQLADGVTFLHVATIETDDGSNPLDGVPAFASFGRDIAARCDSPPKAETATLVGNYRSLEEPEHDQ